MIGVLVAGSNLGNGISEMHGAAAKCVPLICEANNAINSADQCTDLKCKITFALHCTGDSRHYSGKCKKYKNATMQEYKHAV